MKNKIFTRLLAFILTIVMLTASTSMLALATEKTATAPKDYASAADGELLYTLDFESTDFRVGRGGTYLKGISKLDGVRNGSSLRIGYENVKKTTENQKIIGTLPAYPLANKNYTLDFDFSLNMSGERAKVYFGFGQFTEVELENPTDQTLALEVNYKNKDPFRLMRDCTTLSNEVSFHNRGEFVKENRQSHFKIVLSGSAENEGYVTVDYAIYTKGAYDNDMVIKSGQFITPVANAFVTVGIGEWNKITKEGQFYSISNVALYKGDISAPTFAFQTRYDALPFGAELLRIDTTGIGDEAKNNVNSYSWTQASSGVTVDVDGYVYCNPTEDGTYGVYTTLPLEDEWDYEYYTLELALNSDRRCAIGLLDIGDFKQIGFGFGANCERKMQEDGETPVIDDDRYFGTSFTQGGVAVDESYAQSEQLLATGVQLTTYNVNAQRVFTGSKINVKMEFDCSKKIITLYEKTNDGWVKVAAIDYSGVANTTKINHIFSLHATDAGANVVIKTIKYTKGLSLTHLVRYSAGDLSSEIYYEADANEMKAISDAYLQKYNLEDRVYGFTANGTKTEVDLEALYSALDEQFYGILDLKLMPLINYKELADGEAAIRGVRFVPAKDGKMQVNFVSVFDDYIVESITDHDYVGFDVTKTYRESEGGEVKREKTLLRSYGLCEEFNYLGTEVSAGLLGGKYVSSATLFDQTVSLDGQSDYTVTLFTVKKDGTRVDFDTERFSFVGGEYVPTATPLTLAQ